MSPPERELFLSLAQDYRREAFVEHFWRARDPYPSTITNEFRTAWYERVADARAQFGDLAGDRARTLLLLGRPPRRWSPSCGRGIADLDIWSYKGTEQRPGGWDVAFLRAPTSRQADPYVMWKRTHDQRSLLDWTSAASASMQQAREVIRS